MKGRAVLAALALVAAAPAAAQTSDAKPISADARQIVDAIGLQRQIDFMITKLSPAFARMAGPVMESERFKTQLAAPEGRERLRAVFQEEFERAFRSHAGELVEVVARDYDSRLSPSELHSVAAFLSSGAGAKWAAALGDVQQTSSDAGGRIGALAGEQAYDAVLKRLDGKTGLVK